MHDNKVRLSQDVLEKAERIASEWGLKNARAAVEAVFRKYCDDYLYGRDLSSHGASPMAMMPTTPATYGSPGPGYAPSAVARPPRSESGGTPPCEALDALDQLLAL
jgi:hypothetical protein